MEMDLDQLDHVGKRIEETSVEELLPPGSPDINDIFGDPLVHPRVGNEYQVEIPPMITESERFQLLMDPVDTKVMVDVSHFFLVGLPIPVMWVQDETNIRDEGMDFLRKSNDAVNANGSVESKNRKKSQINSSKKYSKHKLEPLDVGLDNREELRSTILEPTTAEKSNLDPMHRSKSYCPVPGSLGDSWSDVEVDSFLLGLYIFGKNLVQVKKFMESREMGEILSFYYGKFYRSDGHHRWSDCRKMRSRKCILGQRIFTGWRQQELISRLLPRVSDELQNTLLEVSKTFAEGKTSLEEYVSTLKTTVGISFLREAVGIGKGKEDLTGIAMDPIKTNQVFPVRPEIPIGKACSSLTSGDIIKFLTGDFRLSKARSNDLFWEAVWPRLLARGWHSEQPKNQGYTGSKHYLVFLMPGVKKFSRRKLVKGDHYFDSVSDVLSKVASEPNLLKLEAEEARVSSCKEEIRWVPGTKLERDDPSDHQRHCYLKPRVSTCSPNLMKFTVVDTSLVHGEKSSMVRELRSLPVETNNTSNLISLSRETEGHSSDDSLDEPASTIMLLNGKNNTKNSNHAKSVIGSSGSNQMFPINGSDAAKKLVENHQDQNTNASDDKQLRRIIKHQFSRRVKSGHSNYLAPIMKRRRLTACTKAETSRIMENFSVGPGLRQEKSHCMLDSPNASKNVVSQVIPREEKVSSVTSSAEGRPEEESSEGILSRNPIGMDISHENNEKLQPWPLIDLNLPQVQPDSNNGEPFIMEVEGSRGNPNSNGSCFSSYTNELVEDSEGLRTSIDVSTAEQQPVMNPRRQSTRNRPLTTRALEALESSGFLNTKRKRKGKEVQTRENGISRPSHRARSRVTVTSNCDSTGTGILDSKEEKGVDGVCNGNTNVVSKTLVRAERKVAHELLGISKAAHHPEILSFKDD